MKAKVILVITGANGTISKTFRQYLSNLLEKLKIKQLQKKVIFGTAHRLAEVLMYKHKTYFMCEITLHAAQTKYRTAATLYTLETWFVLGIQL
jgi:ribosome-associated translation inhibitor RaiA